MRECMKNVIDFLSGDVIMIEKPYTLGKLAEYSQNVHFMFVVCSVGFEYNTVRKSN